jgi:hypothetical protein
MRCHRRRPSSSVVGCIGCALSGSCQAAAAMGGQGQGCPFGLHALLPVPDAILDLGPTHPEALAWLAAHWGVKGHALTGYGLFARGNGLCGETPTGRDRHAGDARPAVGAGRSSLCDGRRHWRRP